MTILVARSIAIQVQLTLKLWQRFRSMRQSCGLPRTPTADYKAAAMQDAKAAFQLVGDGKTSTDGFFGHNHPGRYKPPKVRFISILYG